MHPELAQWVGEQKFESVSDVIASQRGLMRMKGVPPDQLLRLEPDWDKDPEKAAAVFARMGRPEKPEGYEIPDIPVGDGDTNLADGFRQWAHKAGLSVAQAKVIANEYQGALTAFAQQRQTAMNARNEQEMLELKTEWGGAYEENDTVAGRAIEQTKSVVGLEDKDFVAIRDAIGPRKAMKLFASMGRALGEHEPVGGEAEAAFGLTPAAAGKKADQIQAELNGMDRGNPAYADKLDEMMRYRALAHGQVPEPLPRR